MPGEVFTDKPWKGTAYWTNEIKRAGIFDTLKKAGGFNDVITGTDAPTGYGDPVVTDVELDGKVCDIYHAKDAQRIYVHKKQS